MKKLVFLFAIIFIGCKPYSHVTPLSQMADLNYAFETKNIQLDNGISIAYTDQGSGEQTLLFVHGLGSYSPAWIKQLEVLKQQFRCIAIDLPGYGKSSKADYTYDMKFFAEVVKEFIEKAELKNVTLVGHSMGGQIGVTIALYYPELLQNLILVSPAGFETFHEGQKQWFRDVFSARLVKLTPAEAIQSNLGYNFYNLPKDAEFMVTDRLAMRTAKDFDWYCYAIEMSVKGMVNQPVFDYLQNLNLPVLVFFGENDNLIPNRYLNPGKTEKIAKAGSAEIKNAELIMLPKCGHFSQFEQSELVNENIKRFMSKP